MITPTGIISDEQFRNKKIDIDDNHYFRCVFTSCKIVFSGKGPVRFDQCVFDSCEWVFDGAAENTLLYLSALFNGLGPGGTALVESIFNSIRQGGIEQGILTMLPPQPALAR